MAQYEGFILPAEVLNKAKDFLEQLKEHGNQFANGRAVRNLFGEMKMCLARRTMTELQQVDFTDIDKESLVTFSLNDVPGVWEKDAAPFQATSPPPIIPSPRIPEKKDLPINKYFIEAD
jgi:hypothetical protein